MDLRSPALGNRVKMGKNGRRFSRNALGEPTITSALPVTRAKSGCAAKQVGRARAQLPHPVHANRKSPRHGYFGDLRSSPHRQVEILTAPFRVAAHGDLRRFHQQETQQGAALFRDASQPS